MAETPTEFDRTKAEYIDRRQIHYTWWQKQDGTFTDGVTLQSVIDDMPTADVVSVVRCKDCKYFEIDEGDELGECKCGYISLSYSGVLYPHRTDFCNYGERKN